MASKTCSRYEPDSVVINSSTSYYTDYKYYDSVYMFMDAFDESREEERCMVKPGDVYSECIVKEPKSEVTIFYMLMGIETLENVQLLARLYSTENTQLVTNDY
eukprot:487710_1